MSKGSKTRREYSKRELKESRIIPEVALRAVLIGILFNFSYSLNCVFWGSYGGGTSSIGGLALFSPQSLLVSLLVTIVSYILIKNASEYIDAITVKNCAYQGKHTFVIAFICCFLCWSFWFATFYPGTGMNDTLNCIMNQYGSENQPILFQIIIWNGIRFGMLLFGSMTSSYAMLVAIQMLIMAYLIARTVSWVEHKVPQKVIVYCIMAYYALLPIIADYSIALLKDSLYAVFVARFMIYSYEAVITNGKGVCSAKNYLAILGNVACICAFRNNGKFVAIIALCGLLCVCHYGKKAIVSMICIICFLTIGITNWEKSNFQTDVGFRESVGVPLAQIGAVLNDPKSKLSDDDLDILNKVLPVEIWKNNYQPSFVDRIKFNEEFNNNWLNENKALFIKTWGHIVSNNLVTSIKAYMCHSYGYWSLMPFPPDESQSVFTAINNNTSPETVWGLFCSKNNLQNHSLLPQSVSGTIAYALQSYCLVNMLVTPGFMILLICIAAAMLAKRFGRRIIIALLPVYVNWGTMMIASPASLIYRYSFYLVLSLPIVYVMIIGLQGDRQK